MPHTGKTATCRCAYTTAALTIWVSWPGRIGISERLRRRQNQHGAPLQKLLGEPLQLGHDHDDEEELSTENCGRQSEVTTALPCAARAAPSPPRIERLRRARGSRTNSRRTATRQPCGARARA